MLSYLIIYWNVIYLICCVLLNFASLIVHLGTWRSRYRGRSPNRDRYRDRVQTSGTEVSAPAAVTVFYLISVNLVKIWKTLNSTWESFFLFFSFSVNDIWWNGTIFMRGIKRSLNTLLAFCILKIKKRLRIYYYF